MGPKGRPVWANAEELRAWWRERHRWQYTDSLDGAASAANDRQKPTGKQGSKSGKPRLIDLVRAPS